LKGSGFPALRLELEVSETALLTDREATIDCLRQWKKLGVRIAINHFGTNYSNLSYLARLCVDRLKLDKSLIHRMTQERKIAAVVHAVIALGAELDVEVMAEGVETEAQLSMLRDLGCTHAQGFLLARPMPAVQAQLALRKLWGNLPKAAHAAAQGQARAH
jgi:EAL domain-containing protein (putative c-di-GMP-specific phosphodiesterase class I)